MQALNLQLDLAPAAQLPDAHAGQGKTGVSQAESSFGRELDKAIAGSTDGQKQTTHTDSSRDDKIAEAAQQSGTHASEKTPDKTGQTEYAGSVEKNAVDSAVSGKKIDDGIEVLLAENLDQSAASADVEPVFEIHIGQDVLAEGDVKSGAAEAEPVKVEQADGNLAATAPPVLKDGAVQTAVLTVTGETGTAEINKDSESPNKKGRKVSVKENAEDSALLVRQAGTAEQNAPELTQISAQTDAVAMQAGGGAEKRQTPVISVSDLRTQPEAAPGAVNTAGTPDGAAAVTFSAANSLSEAAGKLAVPEGESHFTQLLSKEIQNNAGELVKTGSIILRDNNAGTINLVLHPEELGNVKIRLELTDRLISGKITVASQEAFNAFKANLEILRTAFAESGFETAGFDLNWNGNGGEGGSNEGRREERNAHGLFYSESMPAAIGFNDEGSGAYYALSSVNVMA